MKRNMPAESRVEESSLGRVNGFSDGFFAIIITIMVLDFKRPADATFSALARLWPTWISYLVSFLFLAIVWVNHHYLSRHATMATSRLVWANFGHLFCVSLVPFLTAWMAETRMAAVPVAMYACVFFLVNVTYLILIYETVCTEMQSPLPEVALRLLRYRSWSTLLLFLLAMTLAFWFPLVGFVIVCICLLLYLRPDVRHIQMLKSSY